MFDCGINQIVSDMVSSIEQENERMILKAVQNVGIDVDKEQLGKALFDAKSFYKDGYEDAKKQYEPKWIPVSERPPEENGEYLATVKYIGVETGTVYIDVEEVYYENGKGFNLCDNEKVTAWMPKPQPYEEREDKSE